MAKVMEGYFYAESHEWAKPEGNKVKIGLSDFAQEGMGDIVFVNMPEIGDEITAGEAFTDIESVKAVSDIYAPISGKISAINEDLADSPELINSDCYEAWIVEVEDVEGMEDLMDSAAYTEFLAKENN